MVQQVVTELIVDAQQAEQGTAAYIRAMRSAQQTRDRLTEVEEKGAQAQQRQTAVLLGLTGSIGRTRTEWNRLREGIDPVARATRELETATLRADAALRRGITTQTEVNRVLAVHRQRLDEVTRSQNNSTRAQSPLRDAGEGVLQGFAGRSAFGGALAGIGGAGIVAGTVATGLAVATGAVVTYGDAWVGLGNRLKGAGIATADLASEQAKVVEIATQSRSDLEATNDLYTKFIGVTQTLGVAQGKAAIATKAVGQALQIGGVSADAAKGTILQLGQALGSGVLRGDEFNSMMEGLGVQSPLIKAIADEFHVTTAELRKLAEAGELVSGRVFKAIIDAAPKISTEFDKLDPTLGGAWSNATTAATNFFAAINQGSGASGSLANILLTIAERANLAAAAMRNATAAEQANADFARQQREKYGVFGSDTADQARTNEDYALSLRLRQQNGGIGPGRSPTGPSPYGLDETARGTSLSGLGAREAALELAEFNAAAQRAKAGAKSLAEGVKEAQSAFDALKGMIPDSRTELEKLTDAWHKAGKAALDAHDALDINRMHDDAVKALNTKAEKDAASVLQKSQDAAAQVGMTPLEKQRAQIEAQYRELLKTNKDYPGALDTLQRAKTTDLGAADAAAMLAPLKASKDAIDDQTAALQLQAATFGQTAGEMARLTTEQKLYSEYAKAGIPVGNDLAAAIRGQGDAAADTAQKMADLKERQKEAIDQMDSLRDATKGLFSDIAHGIAEGKSGKEIFKGLLGKLGGNLIDTGAQNLTDTLLGKQGKQGGGLLGGLLGGGVRGASPANPVYVTMGGLGGLPGLGIPGAANSNTPNYAPGSITSSPLPTATGAIPGLPGVTYTGTAASGGLNMAAAMQAIKNIESSGGNYGAIGPLNKNGTRGYGAYQVLDTNVGPWSKKFYGEELTPDAFLRNRGAQDAVFQGQFGAYASRFGPTGAAQAWLGGPGSVGRLGRTDVNGTSVGGYGGMFDKDYAKLSAQVPGALDKMTASTTKLQLAATQTTPALDGASKGTLDFGSSLSSLGSMLGSKIGGPAGGAIGGGIGSIFSLLAGLFQFDGGGYTGPGGKHQVAGVVHKGEVVWSQSDVAAAGGAHVVDAMRRGMSGYADGGIVRAPQQSVSAMAPPRLFGGRHAPASISHRGGDLYVTVQGNADEKAIEQMRREMAANSAKDREYLTRNFGAFQATYAQGFG